MKVQATTESRNFSAGEINPRLRNRRDLVKNQIAVARMENMVSVLEGVATRRPGTEFVLPLRDESTPGRQIPFAYTGADSYNIVFNGGVARFIREGGYVQNPDGTAYQVGIPYSADQLPFLRYVPSGNVLFIACEGKAPYTLTRNADNSWTFATYVPKPMPVDPQNFDETLTVQTNFNGISALSGTITCSQAGIINDDDIGTIMRLDERDLDLVPEWTENMTGLTMGVERRWHGNVYRVVDVGTAGGGGNLPPVHEDGTVQAGAGLVKWRWRHKGYGFVKITSKVSATVFNANFISRPGLNYALPQSIQDVGTYRWWPSAWSNAKGWPDNVRIHQNRLWWFRTDQFWATESDDFYSFEITPSLNQVPTDASSIPGRILSPDGSLVEVQWALTSGVLVLGVRDAEWLLRAPNSADTVTYANIRAIPDGSEGSALHVPALVDGGAAFIGRGRRRIHYINFDRLGERLASDELSAAARHLLKGKAAALAYQRNPERILWVMCQDGTLVGFTFYPRTDPPIVAAHRHPLVNGFVEDLVTVSAPAGKNDVYLIVRRTINGNDRRYIERLADFFEPVDPEKPDATEAWFVDCGKRLDTGGPVTRIGGLAYLEGEEVAVFADGADRGRVIVKGGVIELDRPVQQYAFVGLPINWRIKTLPLEIDTSKGPSKGAMKTVHEVVVDVVESAGGNVRLSGGDNEMEIDHFPVTLTGDVDYGAPIPLNTGPVSVRIAGEPGLEAAVEISGSSTLPFTLAGIASIIQVAGQ